GKRSGAGASGREGKGSVMKAMLSLRARSAAAPRADETFETLDHGVGETARDEAAGRVAQFNIRVAVWVKKRMYRLKKAERATYGELMEAMVAAYEARGASLNDGV